MTLIKKHTTSKGNKLEFYQLNENSMVVIDLSCIFERTYTIGQKQILSFDDYDNDGTIVKDFNQVINAWTNEQIHF